MFLFGLNGHFLQFWCTQILKEILKLPLQHNLFWPLGWNLKSDWPPRRRLFPSTGFTRVGCHTDTWRFQLLGFAGSEALDASEAVAMVVAPLGRRMMTVSTHLKNMLLRLDHFRRDRGENQKYLKHFETTTWFIKLHRDPVHSYSAKSLHF